MRTFLTLAGAAVVGLVASELVMQPAMGTRLQFALFFITATVVAIAGIWIFRRWARTARHLGRMVFVLAVVSVTGVATAVTAASGLMFISSHDLQLLWIVLGFALMLGVVFAASVAGPLTDDLRRIAGAVQRVGEGDLDARTGVARPDEVGSVAAALDETTARLAEVEAQRDRELRARQAFLTAIGHDLRTPLSALRVAVEALEDGVAADPERYLRAMHADVAALSTLVDDLFLLARIESGHLDVELLTVDLSDLADESVEALRPVAEQQGVDVVLETDGHVTTLGGPEALGRVVRNLIDNAIRHSPRGGTVVVGVRGGEMAEVSIGDDGPGFRPDFVDRAFDSFSRDDDARTRSTGGAGLGLAIAKGFIRAHGGSIWADTGPGGQVSFRLPAPVASPVGRRRSP